MRLLPVLLIAGLSMPVLSIAEDKRLASIAPDSSTKPAVNEETVDLASRPSYTLRTRDVAIKTRSRKTQQQFETRLEKYYPQSFAMFVELTASHHLALFETYRDGEPMDSIRRQIIDLYIARRKADKNSQQVSSVQ
ncbi:MAG: hypothetical protein ACWA5Q_01710 [bacterium]